jgi:hypothetical protein
MLTVEKARKLLGPDCPMGDEELKSLLDQLGQMAEIALDAVASCPDSAHCKSNLEGGES